MASNNLQAQKDYLHNPTIIGSQRNMNNVTLSEVGQVPILRNTATSGYPATFSTDADQTLTAAQLLSGLILWSGAIATGRALNFPTAAALVSAIRSAYGTCAVNDTFDVMFVRTATGGVNVTLTGPTVVGTATVAASSACVFKVVITNVTASSEAFSIYVR